MCCDQQISVATVWVFFPHQCSQKPTSLHEPQFFHLVVQSTEVGTEEGRAEKGASGKGRAQSAVWAGGTTPCNCPAPPGKERSFGSSAGVEFSSEITEIFAKSFSPWSVAR